MPLTPSLRHCSNKYKLAREGEKDKEKDEDIEKNDFFFFFMMKSSSVERDEFSVVAWRLTGIQHSGWGGKIIPPARNGERECSGEWFCTSWYHHREAQNHSPEHSRSPFLTCDDTSGTVVRTTTEQPQAQHPPTSTHYYKSTSPPDL